MRGQKTEREEEKEKIGGTSGVSGNTSGQTFIQGRKAAACGKQEKKLMKRSYAQEGASISQHPERWRCKKRTVRATKRLLEGDVSHLHAGPEEAQASTRSKLRGRSSVEKGQTYEREAAWAKSAFSRSRRILV